MIEKQQIIIGYYRQGKSKRALSKELGVSRNTIRKYLLEYEKEKSNSEKSEREKSDSGGVVELPKYNSSGRERRRLTSEITQIIDGYLESNARKIEQGNRKQCAKGTDIHAVLLRKGHQIGYTTVCSYIRQYHQRQKEVFIRQHYEPGQSVEFDWGVVKIRIGGKVKQLMLAVFTSAYSNHRWARLYERQDMSSFLDAHVQYFSAVGYVSQEVVYDNMRVAVRRYTLRNSDKVPTDDLLKISTYYCFAYRFCNARRGNEKGHVERSVEYVRRKAFALREDFDHLEQANQHLLSTCQVLNAASVKDKDKSIVSFFEQEKTMMKAAPLVGYDVGELRSLRVDKYSCIRIDTNYYSVQEGQVGQMVDAKVYPQRIVVYNADNKLIAEHTRAHTRFEYYLHLAHYLKTLRNKPGALAGSLTLKQAEQSIQTIFQNYFKDQAKDFIILLLHIRQKKYSITDWQNALEQCIKLCPHQAVEVDKIKLLLAQKRNQNTKPNTPISTTDYSDMSMDIDRHCKAQLEHIQALIS